MVNRNLIAHEFNKMKQDYPDLYLLSNGRESWKIRGNLHFSAKYENHLVEDAYIVEILIPNEYPCVVPKAKEIGGRIPDSFHKFSDKTLCFGAPISVKRKFSYDRTLSGFFKNCLIPFLSSYTYKIKNGSLPHGELEHGVKGIIQGYMDEFQTKDIKLVIDFLRILTQDIFPGFMNCPCRSGKRLYKCHGEKILELKGLQFPQDFAAELNQIRKFLLNPPPLP